MNDAQTWTFVGGFFTLMVAMIGLTLRGVRAELSVLDARFDGFDRRFDHLDRDVQMIINRFMDG